MATVKPRLFLHSGDEYVGSVEPESLQLLTYLRLAGQEDEIEVTTSCKFWDSPNGHFPVLLLANAGTRSILPQSPSSVVSSAPEGIMSYFIKHHGLDLDKGLRPDQLAEVAAFTALLRDRLKPAILYVHWLDAKNYLEVTRQWYGKATTFPFTLVVLSWKHRKARQQLLGGMPPDSSPEQRKIALMSSAENCLSLLSTRLGEQQLFFGEKECSLDAMVFGYLELILQYNLPGDNTLQQTLHSFPNLVRFCDHIRSVAFPEKNRKPMHLPGQGSKVSGPFWRDPVVWLCAGLSVTVLAVQGVRVGLFRKMTRWGWRWWTTAAAEKAALELDNSASIVD